MEGTKLVATRTTLAIALLLVSDMFSNTTGGNRWIVQARPTRVELNQLHPNTTGGNRWMVQVQPTPGELTQLPANTTGGNRRIVQAQPTPGELTQLLANTTGGNRRIVQVQPAAAKPNQPLPVSAVQTQSDAQTKPEQPRPVKRASPIDTIRRHMQRLGYSIDEAKSKVDMIVSIYSDTKRGKVTIAMVYDKRKEVVSFYIYNFGNVNKAADLDALNKYLLSANDAIIIGGFFVDHDGDIGYKYVSAASQLSLGSFEVIYVTMAGVALDRRPEIRKLIDSGKKEEGQQDKSS